MTASNQHSHESVWTAIEKEKRRDRTLRTIGVAAWGLTFLVVLVFAAIMVLQIMEIQRMVEIGMAPQRSVYLTALPLIGVVGVLSVLIATLATIGIFFRMRTASLIEIQQRLAALEAALTRPDAQ
jgi:hypothetical protein